MTAIVGILCKDGVVIGADSSATFGTLQNRTVEQETRKIDIINDNLIIAGTGSVGLHQRFRNYCESKFDTRKLNLFPNKFNIVEQITKDTIINWSGTHIKQTGLYASLIAFPYKNDFYLCEFDADTFQPEFKDSRLWYCSLGCTINITDSFLAFVRDVFWNEGIPSIQEGIFAATWTLQHVIKCNTGGVNGPIQIGVLKKKENNTFETNIYEQEHLSEHLQKIEDIKSLMLTKLREQNIPPVPIPVLQP